ATGGMVLPGLLPTRLRVYRDGDELGARMACHDARVVPAPGPVADQSAADHAPLAPRKSERKEPNPQPLPWEGRGAGLPLPTSGRGRGSLPSLSTMTRVSRTRDDASRRKLRLIRGGAGSFFLVGQTFLSAKAKADRNVCPTGGRMVCAAYP